MYKYSVNEGYYSSRKSTVIVDMPVNGHNHAQAGIIKKDNGYLLISYSTPVAFVSFDGKIECYGLYSITTRKHIGWFARQFGKDYYDFKNAIQE